MSLFFSRVQSYHPATGYSAAFVESWTPHFASQVAIGVEEPVVCLGGSPFNLVPCTQFKLRTHPIELAGHYQFVNETRWKPYVGLGVRYVRAPSLSPAAVTALGHGYDNHLDPQLVGGVEFLVTPRLGITVDGKQLLADSEAYDPLFRLSAGLSLRF